ncbi:MAG: tRNA uridine-5-carboxymethylaminomethyl(34) synthesis GTPase MnmE, partial [Deltaproteobacteria bacterium]|nr:tRNA uridine-5-carboxymethylaminomethyl(34) synthesis GTPase MnmE [Deltaproteobacteria bacterium]
MLHSDTIAAVSTPVGEGGISILRLSGPHSQAILEALFSPLPDLFTPFHLYLGMIHEPETGKPLDQVLVVRMEAGHSYTREEMAEIHCHGGRLVTREILRLLLDQGARLAEPGEFTRRAFLSGRIDLVQAESVADLIAAGNEQAMQAAIRQLAGGLSGQLVILEQRLSRQLAALEVELDLLEEEGLSFTTQLMVDELDALREKVKQLVSSYEE